MKGTQAAAAAQRTTRAAPAYRWGPGKSFPALAYVLSAFRLSEERVIIRYIAFEL
jgi:hypothetical protein